MKILDTAITEIVRGNSARYYSKYIVEGKEYTNTLNKFNFQNITNPNNEITIGNTCASSVTFSIYMPQVSLENKDITIYEGVKVGNEIKYIKLGTFTVSKQTSNGEYTSYEAYDKMYKADMPYSSDLVFPSTDKAILEEICAKLGISLATVITTIHSIEEKPQGYTMREMIGYMAMLQGCNAVINSDGNLELRWYKDSGYVLDGHKYYQQGVTFTTSKDFIIQKLTCNNTKSGSTEQSQITAGDGATGLSFANPFMTQTILDEVYKKIGGFTFRPLTVKFVGDYRLEVGDIITVNKGGVDYKVPIMQITHECDGGLMDTVTSIGQSESSNNTASSGPITKAMQRYYAELVTINKALINKLDVETAKITYATITNFNAVKGDVDYLKVNNLTVDKANLLYASIERMEVVEGQIRNLNVDDLKAQVANINTLMFGSASGTTLTTEFSNSVVSLIGDAQIKDAMIANISASKITSGAIYTNRVKIYGDNNKRLCIEDNTIQMSDDNDIVRMQMGEDSQGRYNIIIRNSSEDVIFDAVGVTEKGYHDGSIKNIAVADNANIGAEKLNIDSLFNVINNDGSHTLKSSKIYLDSEAQTLDVAFSTMITNVTNVTNTAISQGTQISAIQGQINSKIWKQDITTAVNELQIGGRNLIRAYYIQHFDNGTTDTSEYITSGKVVCQGNGVNTGFRFDSINCYEPSTQYVLSGYITVTSKSCNNIYVFNGKQHSFISFKIDGIAYSNPFDIARTDVVNILNDGKPHFFELRYETNANMPADVDVSYTYIQLNKSNTTQINYEFKFFKLEKGTKATDWTPAPEDVNDDILALTTQYSTLEQTLSGFKVEVGATYATKESLAATNATLELKISKTDTSQIISMINASADAINITAASGGVNISGGKFTLSSPYTTISADGSINCSNLISTNAKITGGSIKIKTDNISEQLINIRSENAELWLTPSEISVINNDTNSSFLAQPDFLSLGANGLTCFRSGSDGTFVQNLTIGISKISGYSGLALSNGYGYELILQGDGNLVLYHNGIAIWDTGTSGQ